MGPVYLGKGAGMLKQLDMVAYQTKSWWFQSDTEPHMIPIDLNLHSTGSSRDQGQAETRSVKGERGNAVCHDPS